MKRRDFLLSSSVTVLGGVVAACGTSGASKTIDNHNLPPAALVGTYTTHLTLPQLPSAMRVMQAPRDWKLVVVNSGGPGGGPDLDIVNVAEGALDAPALSVSGDQLRLKNAECAGPSGGYTFVNDIYRWKLSGNTLTLTTVKAGCPDKTEETVLTSSPWTRSGN